MRATVLALPERPPMRRPRTRGPYRVLPPEEVRAIVRRHTQGEKPAALAREFGVSLRTVYRYLGESSTREHRYLEEILDWRFAFLLSAATAADLAAWIAECEARWLADHHPATDG